MGDKKKKHNEDNHDNNNNNREELREMLEMALEGEQGDFAFYNTLADMVKNPVCKTIFLGIAGDEYGHARTWRAMLELFDCIETV